MGHYVHIHVCFACDSNEGVAELAKNHLMEISGDTCKEAKWFLESLSERTGKNPGPKGGLSLWGMVGNFTDGDIFVRILNGFWKDLLSEIEGGPRSDERILVFVEHEQSDYAEAYEIFLEDDENPETLKIKKHGCPFSWGVM